SLRKGRGSPQIDQENWHEDVGVPWFGPGGCPPPRNLLRKTQPRACRPRSLSDGQASRRIARAILSVALPRARPSPPPVPERLVVEGHGTGKRAVWSRRHGRIPLAWPFRVDHGSIENWAGAHVRVRAA